MLCPLLHPFVNYSLSSIVKVKLVFFRYVALNMLMKAITVDTQAVQRHRATMLECVKVLHGLLMFFLLDINENFGLSINLTVSASFVVSCIWSSNPTFPLPHHLLQQSKKKKQKVFDIVLQSSSFSFFMIEIYTIAFYVVFAQYILVVQVPVLQGNVIQSSSCALAEQKRLTLD